jgi:hypothetical protein
MTARQGTEDSIVKIGHLRLDVADPSSPVTWVRRGLLSCSMALPFQGAQFYHPLISVTRKSRDFWNGVVNFPLNTSYAIAPHSGSVQKKNMSDASIN